MQVTYDDVTGAVYVYLDRPSKVAKTKRVSEHTLLDYDGNGKLIGIELLYPHEGIDLSGLRKAQAGEVERLLDRLRAPMLTA